jgi:RNA polymerase sigma-70 factor (ECF subfamily)
VNRPEHPSDAALAVAARQGDNASFAAIMRRHKGWLYQFIRRYVRDRDEAYDVLQETFVAAWSALARFDTERPMQAWLRRIALNKCRDRARRNTVRRTALRIFGFSAEANASAPAADSTAAADQALSRLEAAIQKLPQGLRESLLLTALEGLSHKEAGELLGINAKAVETRVYRAKKQLASTLDPGDLSDIAEKSE